MGIEIERKFLVKDSSWRESALPGIAYRQGYIHFPKGVVRARIAGEKAFLTVKGAVSGISRLEFEYPIPPADADAMLKNLCAGPLIEKTRFIVPFKGFKWEMDVFEGENKGLVVAELELEDEAQEFPRPAWLGEEVTADLRYANSNLARNPFSKWS